MPTPRGKTFLPDHLLPAHNLCLLNHDILVELLRSGEEQKVFVQQFKLLDEADKRAYAESEDVLEWLDRTGRADERARLVRRTVFPAVLSDLLHFLFEALESSRKAKLNVAYALIRKPIQESLFLLEVIATDAARFVQLFAENPLSLRAQKAGSFDAHVKRIEKALVVLQEQHRFDASYLAQLRYGRNTDDSFDPVCNRAAHLFTEHPALRTEPLNINFVFSDYDAKLTQWYYLYSRLPYLLFYTRRLVEYICLEFGQTNPEYLSDMERRVSAGTILWASDVEERYRQAQIEKFVEVTRCRMFDEYRAAFGEDPSHSNLVKIRDEGMSTQGSSPTQA